MLLELTVRDFAMIASCRVVFGAGLNVLTGETGAGKSILVQATLVLLGGRASSELVRKGAETAVVEGVFRVDDPATAQEITGLGTDLEDGILVLRRAVERKGRSRAWINGGRTSVSVLRRLGRLLIDLQGQHEQQDLLQPARHLAYLDAWGDHGEVRGEAEGEIARFRGLLEERTRLLRLEEEAREKERFVRFEVEELESLDPKRGETARLEEEAKVLEHAHRLHHLIGSVRDELYEKDGSAIEALGSATKELLQAASLDGRLEEWLAVVENSRLDLEECARELGRYLEGLDAGAETREQILERLQEIRGASRKFDRDEAGLIALLEEGREFLDRVDHFEEDRKVLEGNLAGSLERLAELLPALSHLRKEAARKLDRIVTREMGKLGFRGASFRTRVAWEEGDDLELEGRRWKLRPTGLDRVEFHLRPGPGENPLPLARVASGGELSRIALALESLLVEEDRSRTVIFDEIDSGVGADLGDALGRRLEEVASRAQTLLITHMPQIAARADHHVRVVKRVGGRRSETTSEVVEGEQRVREIARMLGGEEGSEARMAHARELVRLGRSAASAVGR